MAVTAKFKVGKLTPWNGEIVDGRIVAEDGKPTGEVELVPDYAGGRNAEWASATPAGVLRLSITNPPALAYFELGAPYTLTVEREEE